MGFWERKGRSRTYPAKFWAGGKDPINCHNHGLRTSFLDGGLSFHFVISGGRERKKKMELEIWYRQETLELTRTPCQAEPEA